MEYFYNKHLLFCNIDFVWLNRQHAKFGLKSINIFMSFYSPLIKLFDNFWVLYSGYLVGVNLFLNMLIDDKVLLNLQFLQSIICYCKVDV